MTEIERENAVMQNQLNYSDMKNGVTYIRHSPSADLAESKSKLNMLLANFCDVENIKIIKSWEDVNDADTVFDAPGWCDMEDYLYNHRFEIDVIVVPTTDTLFENNLYAIMAKTDFMDSINIEFVMASTHTLNSLK